MLSTDLTPEQRSKLDGLLDSRGESRQTYLGWVRQSLGAANPTNILSCLERLTFLRSLGIPATWSARLHQNRLVQIAREGANTDVTHLRAFNSDRRYGTLVAGVLDAMTELIDEALEMHERYLGQQFKKAERRHLAKFQENGKAINETLKRYAALGRALIDAKTQNADLFAAVERVLPWNELAASVAELAASRGLEKRAVKRLGSLLDLLAADRLAPTAVREPKRILQDHLAARKAQAALPQPYS